MSCPDSFENGDPCPALQRLQAENQLLRQAMVRSSFAVVGHDSAVDHCLRELRQVLRGEDGAQLEAVLAQLDIVLVDVASRRSASLHEQRHALIGQATKLQTLNLSQELHRAITQFSQALDEIDPLQLDLSAALSEFNQYQWQVLAQFVAHKSLAAGLLEGLGTPASALPGDKSAVSNELDRGVSPSSENTAAADDQPSMLGYAYIVGRVESILYELFEDDDLPANYQLQARRLKRKINRGLHGYELVTVVESLARLVRDAASDQRSLGDYLQQLIERLAEFQASLMDMDAAQADEVALARDLDQQLRAHVDHLQHSVREAQDLEQLKTSLTERLDSLLASLTQQREQRERRDQALLGRLKVLAERVAELESEAQHYRAHIDTQQRQTLLDPLTGLPNRAAWNARLRTAMEQWQARGGELLLAILDVDHFKQVNDSYGHLAGDKVLKLIADALVRELGEKEFIARFGGEEFVLLLPDRSLASGQDLLRRLLASIEACPFHFKGERLPITLSAGLASFRSAETGEEAFQRADQALYRAKHEGRNRLVVDGEMTVCLAP
jgi:diguanylate cyclase